MKQSVNFETFRQSFINFNRLENFPTGLRALFEYLEELEHDTGEELELDVIALCCDFCESKLSEVLKEYNLESLEDLQNNTTVIMVDSEQDKDPTIIYGSF